MSNLTSIANTKWRESLLAQIKANGLDTDNVSHTYIYDLGLTTLLHLSQQSLPNDAFTKAYVDANLPK